MSLDRALIYRPRRLRQTDALRRFVRETHLSADQLVMPLFVRSGKQIRAAIPSMPGQFQLSIDQLVNECHDLKSHGVPAVLLFGLHTGPKDERASGAYAKDGIIQQAVRAIKDKTPELLVITDVCLCEYMSHGHCGVVKYAQGSRFKAQGKSRSKKPSASPARLLRKPGRASLQPRATRGFETSSSAS